MYKVEKTYHINNENNWLLKEFRIFDSRDMMVESQLHVFNLKTKELVNDERLDDDVWQFEWETDKKESYDIEKLYNVCMVLKCKYNDEQGNCEIFSGIDGYSCFEEIEKTNNIKLINQCNNGCDFQKII